MVIINYKTFTSNEEFVKWQEENFGKVNLHMVYPWNFENNVEGFHTPNLGNGAIDTTSTHKFGVFATYSMENEDV